MQQQQSSLSEGLHGKITSLRKKILEMNGVDGVDGISEEIQKKITPVTNKFSTPKVISNENQLP